MISLAKYPMCVFNVGGHFAILTFLISHSSLDRGGDRSVAHFYASLAILLFTLSLSKTKANMDKYKEVTKNLKHITRHSDETEGIRVEKLIGFTQLPLGVAGPLQIHGHYQKGSIVAPLATVEATLVAGVG